MAKQTLDELNEESKAMRDKEWKNNQLDRIEQTVDRTHNIVKAIGFFGFLILLAIWLSVTN